MSLQQPRGSLVKPERDELSMKRRVFESVAQAAGAVNSLFSFCLISLLINASSEQEGESRHI